MAVLPFCEHDVQMFLKNLRWMWDMGDHYDCDALLSCDTNTSNVHASQMQDLCRKIFRKCIPMVYTAPTRDSGRPPLLSLRRRAEWPYHRKPWFWFEYDQIPLKLAGSMCFGKNTNAQETIHGPGG